MRSTGMVRRTDKLGRIVIPIEIRKKLKIKPYDELEMFSEGENIILKKFEESCTFCGSTINLIRQKDKLICEKCIKESYKKIQK